MKALWETVLDQLRGLITEENYATYFGPLRYAHAEDDTLHLAVDDPFFRDWIREHYLDLIQEQAALVAGRPIAVQLDIAEGPPNHAAPASVAPAAITAVAPREAVSDTEAFPLNPHYLFDQFVVGPNNEMAHAASRAVAERPARSFNPLFIYGGTGLGKTHLLHAIAHRIRSADPSKRIVYVSAEEFTNQVIKSISRQKMDDFRRRFRARCDVLLMDDVHILSGKERTQEEFFHTFNALHGAQKQIVLTSDKTPQEIQHLEERLRSRFNWGLITDIKPPQFETRVAIVQRRAEREQIHLSDEVAFYLARLISANVRELEGALTRLVAYASFNREPVTIEFAQRALKDIIDKRARAVSIESIQKMVAEHFDVKVADLRGNRRQRVISHPRSIAMYLCRKHTQASFPAIGRGFSKDHSTVISACRRVSQGIDDDHALRAEIESIERRLSS